MKCLAQSCNFATTLLFRRRRTTTKEFSELQVEADGHGGLAYRYGNNAAGHDQIKDFTEVLPGKVDDESRESNSIKKNEMQDVKHAMEDPILEEDDAERDPSITSEISQTAVELARGLVLSASSSQSPDGTTPTKPCESNIADNSKLHTCSWMAGSWVMSTPQFLRTRA